MRTTSPLSAAASATKLRRLDQAIIFCHSLGVTIFLAIVVMLLAAWAGLGSEATRAIILSPRVVIGFPILGGLSLLAAIALRANREAFLQEHRITRAGQALDEPNLSSQ